MKKEKYAPKCEKKISTDFFELFVVTSTQNHQNIIFITILYIGWSS